MVNEIGEKNIANSEIDFGEGPFGVRLSPVTKRSGISRNNFLVFKIRAELELWNSSDQTPRPSIVVLEECVSRTSLNRQDLKALVKSSVFGKLAKFGADTTKLDYQFLSVQFFAGKTHNIEGAIFDSEPEWVPAYDFMAEPFNEARQTKAIQDSVYLPVDIKEQREVYDF